MDNDEYDKLNEELLEKMDELEYLNSSIYYPFDDRYINFLEIRRKLINEIKELRCKLFMSEDFNTQMGYDPFKDYRMDFLFSESRKEKSRFN